MTFFTPYCIVSNNDCNLLLQLHTCKAMTWKQYSVTSKLLWDPQFDASAQWAILKEACFDFSIKQEIIVNYKRSLSGLLCTIWLESTIGQQQKLNVQYNAEWAVFTLLDECRPFLFCLNALSWSHQILKCSVLFKFNPHPKAECFSKFLRCRSHCKFKTLRLFWFYPNRLRIGCQRTWRQ